MIQVIEIGPRQRDHILGLEEGHFVDLKSLEIAPAKLTEFVSSFANSSGGELFIGIEERKSGKARVREWNGFPTQEAANGHIQAFERLFPLGQDYSYTFLSTANRPGLVLHVQVQKTRDIVIASNNKPYIRRGAQKLPVDTPEMLNTLRMNKGIASFEDRTIDAPLARLLDSETLKRFLEQVVPRVDAISWLRKQLLIVNGKPTIAAILLFDDEPQAVLPKRCAIKVYRYRTSDHEGKRPTLAFDPFTVEGPLYDQIRVAVIKTTEFVEQIPVLSSSGLEPITYPFETLHEVVTNAVLHRDYSFQTDTQIRIYDNRIEVESPGVLPGHITVENILREQFARNGKLVRLINKFPNPPNKDVGEGLNTAFFAMSKMRLAPPEIKESEHSVLVAIKHERLASPDQMIMQYLDLHDSITNKIARSIAGTDSEAAIKTVFNRLRQSGLIEVVPGTSRATARWRKAR